MTSKTMQNNNLKRTPQGILTPLQWAQPQVKKAWEALRILPLRDRHCVAAASIADEWLRRFRAINGLTVSSVPCIYRLLGHRCDCRLRHDCRPPGSHASVLFLKQGKPWCYITQPYEVGEEVVGHMCAFAARHGLTFQIRGRDAWNFPGESVCVLWMKRENASLSSRPERGRFASAE